jgi:hypothetical protein
MELGTETFQAIASVSAFRVVAPATAAVGHRRCQLWTTNTMHIIGVSQENASTNGSVPVATHLGDIVRVVCDLSVSVGALVGPGTATGGIVERALAVTAAVWAVPRLGIALESGSTNSVINVLLNTENVRTS